VSAKVLFDTFSLPKLRALANRFQRNHTAVVPTLSLYWSRVERRRAASVIAGTDRLQYIPPAYVVGWKALPSLMSEEEERLQLEQSLAAVRELNQAGVMMLAGTDVMNPFLLPGFSLHDELSLLVKAGLSEMQALQAATRNPARAFNLPDQGTIESGMRADLLLLDANPLQNIDNTRKIRLVVSGGRVFERNDLDAMFDDIRRGASEWKGTPTR
jgi:imidazolonepropionase-like amidohydrolase